MEAYEFMAKPENDFIPIPEQYRGKFKRDIKVIVLDVWPEKAEPKIPPGVKKSDYLLPPTLDTRGWKFDREEANERNRMHARKSELVEGCRFCREVVCV